MKWWQRGHWCDNTVTFIKTAKQKKVIVPFPNCAALDLRLEDGDRWALDGVRNCPLGFGRRLSESREGSWNRKLGDGHLLVGLRRSLDGVNVTQGTSNVNDSWERKRYTFVNEKPFHECQESRTIRSNIIFLHTMPGYCYRTPAWAISILHPLLRLRQCYLTPTTAFLWQQQ